MKNEMPADDTLTNNNLAVPQRTATIPETGLERTGINPSVSLPLPPVSPTPPHKKTPSGK